MFRSMKSQLILEHNKVRERGKRVTFEDMLHKMRSTTFRRFDGPAPRIADIPQELRTEHMNFCNCASSKWNCLMHLASLPNDVYKLLMTLVQMYQRYELKGMSKPKRKKKKGAEEPLPGGSEAIVKPDVPVKNLEHMAVKLDVESIQKLLTDVTEKRRTFNEIKSVTDEWVASKGSYIHIEILYI